MGCNLTIWHQLLWLFKGTTGCLKRQPTVKDASWFFITSMILILSHEPLSLWPLDIQLRCKKQFLPSALEMGTYSFLLPVRPIFYSPKHSTSFAYPASFLPLRCLPWNILPVILWSTTITSNSHSHVSLLFD